MAIRENLWDCESCGKVGNLGRNRECESCGLSRPHGVHFYLPENAPEVTDKEQLKQARSGPDWICGHCDASNSAGSSRCKQCSASKTNVTQKIAKVIGLQREWMRSNSKRIRQEVQKRGAAHVFKSARKSSKFWLYVWLSIGAAALISIVTLIWMYNATYEVEVVVDSVKWHRSIDVEHYKTLNKSGWSPPSDARIQSNEQRIRSYRKVPDGYVTKTREVRVQTGTRRVKTGTRNLGNGYSEDVYSTEPIYEYRTETYQEQKYRDEPVYDTYYYYEVDRWVVVAKSESSGADHEPYWSKPDIGGDKQREGEYKQSYYVYFKADKERIWEHKLQYDDWMRYGVGEQRVILVNYFDQFKAVK